VDLAKCVSLSVVGLLSLRFSLTLQPPASQTDHPAACEKFGEQNFGSIRNTNVGNKAAIVGEKGEEMCVFVASVHSLPLSIALIGRFALGKPEAAVSNAGPSSKLTLPRFPFFPSSPVSLANHSYGTFFGQSAFAKHALVVEQSVVKVPDGTDLVTLAPLGCGLQTGAGTILNLCVTPLRITLRLFFEY
jgi:hypothetical protein